MTFSLENEGEEWRSVKNRGDRRDREKVFEFILLVVRAFEVVQVLEGDLLQDGVDGLRVEALADVLGHGSIRDRKRPFDKL
jgi:hypothetical protein